MTSMVSGWCFDPGIPAHWKKSRSFFGVSFRWRHCWKPLIVAFVASSQRFVMGQKHPADRNYQAFGGIGPILNQIADTFIIFHIMSHVPLTGWRSTKSPIDQLILSSGHQAGHLTLSGTANLCPGYSWCECCLSSRRAVQSLTSDVIHSDLNGFDWKDGCDQ